MARLTNIEGIGQTYCNKLHEAGVDTQAQLLKTACTPQGRSQLAKQTGISTKKILGWVNRADLTRIRGIGEEFADLLEVSGVDTVPELARRNAENLSQTLRQVNNEKHVVRHIPGQKQVLAWIDQAQHLPKVIKY